MVFKMFKLKWEAVLICMSNLHVFNHKFCIMLKIIYLYSKIAMAHFDVSFSCRYEQAPLKRQSYKISYNTAELTSAKYNEINIILIRQACAMLICFCMIRETNESIMWSCKKCQDVYFSFTHGHRVPAFAPHPADVM